MFKLQNIASFLTASLTLLCCSLSFNAMGKESLADKISLSGMLKVDFIYDIDTPSGDRINYGNIPTSSLYDESQARVHVRESRIGLKYQDSYNGLPFAAYVEGDFYGGGTNSPSGSEKISNSTEFRLRHGYLTYAGWLVGQTWSNYVDVSSFPETLDFSNDTGQAFIRQGQVRYKHSMGNFNLSYAIENPESDLIIADESFQNIDGIDQADPMFDLTAKVQYHQAWGHVSLQTVIRTLEMNTSNNSETELGYGVGTSGKIKITDSNLVKFHYSQGEGIGRYIQEVAGSAGIVYQSQQDIQNSEASIELLEAKGGYVSFQHKFSPAWRANISGGFIDIDFSEFTNDAIYADYTEKLTSFHANIIWTIFPNLDVGIEHSIVDLTTVSGAEGKLKRVQLSTKFKF